MISASELVRSLGSLLLDAPPRERLTGVRFRRACIDSRQTKSGDLFVALRGAHEDGNDFIPDALERGATGILAERTPEGGEGRALAFRVPDTLVALQRLAAARRDRSPARVIGITGSVGKTTTKEITAAVLRRAGAVLKNRANYNSETGLPLTLLDLRRGHRYAVLEMGMYARGEIRLLCEIARPHVGVVTNVGPSHLERLGSVEAIADAKAELPESLPPDGVAVLNGDDERVAAMASRTPARPLLFGTASRCHVRGEDVESEGLKGLAFTLRYGEASVRVRTPLPGRHLLANALAAAAVGLVEGMTLDDVAGALAGARVPLRLRTYRGRRGTTIIDDTYNASPASMMAALDLLSELPGRRVALLGDMRELGQMEEQGHVAVGRRAAEVADVIYAVGELARVMGQAAVDSGHRQVAFRATKEEAALDLRRHLKPGDVILVKGSRAMALETVLPELRE